MNNTGKKITLPGPVKFREGELIEMKDSKSIPVVYQVRSNKDGEPVRHRIKKKTGEVEEKGVLIKVTDKFKRINNYLNN